MAGYSAIAAGLALMPITLLMWVLSRRFGALSDRIGPRLLMGFGPIVAGLGIVWLGQLGAEVTYVTDVLPGVLVFGLGLSATVAPLTNTVLGSVPQHNAGVASGINNQIARVASLLAIAAVGAVVAATFESELGREGVDPLSGGSPEVVDASVEAYRTGMVFAGCLVMIGGVISLAGIVNPRREDARAAATSRARCGSSSRAPRGAARPRHRPAEWATGSRSRCAPIAGWPTPRSPRSC